MKGLWHGELSVELLGDADAGKFVRGRLLAFFVPAEAVDDAEDGDDGGRRNHDKQYNSCGLCFSALN